ncbi:MAG TPA: glutamine--tRNA ligase [Dehalococcoidia bacterium]|jgi:glutaminyl-tRNA synthetase|nr:glutamine--tRNA ligase [Dehalococcoidia bacterium]|tara:strand:+ start:19 stop:1668 length:1650 start_codon:yes stop_codon:yes gene_type:complete
MEDIEKPINFIYQAINDDIDEGRFSKNIVTRFPPEPNGYLHIGHAKSICLNFGIVEQYENAKCHLRLDDTNPSKESNEFVEAIKENVSWLGFDWGNNLFYASDYFDQFYEHAVTLIELGKAYVCDLNFEDIRKLRGTLTTPGENSPYRNRTVKENLELFSNMKNGLIPEGDKVLRAKIDMASPNLNMRDPTLYRIRHVSHYRTGSKWCIYPMYDFAHCVSDSIEQITHSICTLEFEDHRPLYDWILDSLDLFHPRQIEFPRLNITHTVLSKRNLLSFVEDSKVNGWDDPRMPTLSGMRRRGYTPSAIREFCSKVGLSKRDSVIEIQLLEHCLREDLNASAKRVLGVINPLKLVIDNYPEGKVEFFDAANNPEKLEDGTRRLPFSKYLFIENSDFQEYPENKFYRFAPGNEVRLRYAYIAKCTSYTVDPVTNVVSEIHCDIDFESRGGMPSDGRRIRGTVHWVSASHAVKGIVKHFDYLLKNSETDEIESETIFTECLLEESLANSVAGQVFQFERLGYYCRDIYDSQDGTIIFNQTVSLRDSWGKRNQN